MPKNKGFWATRQGWIFCLNAPEGSETGSNWGYSQDFVEDIYADAKPKDRQIKVYSRVYGKPYSKYAQISPGEGIVFYHGKKARVSSETPSMHVKPYQLTLAGHIDDIYQSPESGEVEELAFSVPKDVCSAFVNQPLRMSDKRISEIVSSSGLGGGRVGSFFPIDPPHWDKLLKIVKSMI